MFLWFLQLDSLPQAVQLDDIYIPNFIIVAKNIISLQYNFHVPLPVTFFTLFPCLLIFFWFMNMCLVFIENIGEVHVK